MSKTQKPIAIILILFLTLLTGLPLLNYTGTGISNMETSLNTEKNEWIIKWNDQFDKEALGKAEILEWIPELNIMVVRLPEQIQIQNWLQNLKEHPDVKYIEPNNKLKISQAPNSHFNSQQYYYLQQINAELGWDNVKTSGSVTVAVLDTGIDLEHPDLKSYLVDGINLVKKDKPPQDDNGHGTNVAGIVAAVGNSKGLTWNTKIMPIKVLDQYGIADNSFFVGQGIRYAVDNGAKIILLSLGEPIFSPFMYETVEYAKSKGVLVIAAAGNDSSELNYPAAFSTVLSVGAVDSNDNYSPYSNYGQQLDVVAPGEDIFTTNFNGEYIINSGTSMAAPQVAGLAALLYSKYPDMTPKEIADLIKFTADDVGETGRDNKTGYGRINMEATLSAPKEILIDGYETNNYNFQAHHFPLGDTFNAQLNSIDTDWYKLLLPYDGKVEINVTLDQILEHGVLLEIYSEDQIPKEPPFDLSKIGIFTNHDSQNDQNQDIDTNQDNEQTEESNKPLIYQIRKEETIIIDLPKGYTYLKLSLDPAQAITDINLTNYTISNKYKIYKDEYGDNKKPWQAYPVEKLNTNIIGTLDNEHDKDWYKISLKTNGILTVNVSTDTVRMDPVLLIQPVDGLSKIYDYQDSGKEETTHLIVSKGEYLIRVSDYNNNRIEGEYRLQLNFKTTNGDSYEPNDISNQSTLLNLTGQNYQGIIANKLDFDWFQFIIAEKSYIISDFTADKEIEVILYNEQLEALKQFQDTAWNQGEVIEEGTYYLRISSNNQYNPYSFSFVKLFLDGNFTDIHYHWAKDVILKLYEEDLMDGYEDYSFKPNQDITRAEAAEVLSNALELTDEGNIQFSDISQDNEFYAAIAKVVAAGIIQGYDDNTFKPDQQISREELVLILTKSFNVHINHNIEEWILDDLYINNKAFYEINTFFKNGWLNYFIEGNSFKPEKTITRAEFAVLFDTVKNGVLKQNDTGVENQDLEENSYRRIN